MRAWADRQVLDWRLVLVILAEAEQTAAEGRLEASLPIYAQAMKMAESVGIPESLVMAGESWVGALLEVSSDDGSTWSQVFAGLSLVPYDGAISGAYQNPLGGRQAWCGDPRGYQRTIADLTSYAGETVKFRFRLGHDRFEHRDGVNWAIDDVVVTGCPR